MVHFLRWHPVLPQYLGTTKSPFHHSVLYFYATGCEDQHIYIPGFKQVGLGPHMPISPGAEHRFEAVGMGRPGPDQGLLAGAEGLRQLPAYYSHWIGL